MITAKKKRVGERGFFGFSSTFKGIFNCGGQGQAMQYDVYESYSNMMTMRGKKMATEDSSRQAGPMGGGDFERVSRRELLLEHRDVVTR